MGPVQSYLRASELSRVAGRRRAARDEAHAAFSPDAALPPAPSSDVEALALGARDVAELHEHMRAGRLTSVQLVSVYIRRCHSVGFALGGITEELYGPAVAAARESDARRERGEPLRPLEGIPISVKDMFVLAGTDSTCGLACKAFRPFAADGVYVRLLREAGAVPVAKTNVPQCLMVPESDNFIFGRSLNPYDVRRTPGGSSGGEGTLLASRCSFLGIGTDIGGSIRIPSTLCGLYSLKPTPSRLTQHGLEAPRPHGRDGQNGVFATAGPMGRSVADLAAVMRAWLVPKLWEEEDPTVPRMPFDEEAYAAKRPLRIAFYETDEFWEAAAPCKRAVREAADALRAAGHELVALPSPTEGLGLDTYRAGLLYYALMASDGKLREFKRGLEGERLHPLYSLLDVLASLPDFGVRPAIAGLLRLVGLPRMADMLAIARRRSADEYWALVEERDAMKAALVKTLRERRIDLLLTPGVGIPAFRHGGSRDLTPVCSYTFLWNLLHFPAGTVPVSRVRPDEEGYACPRRQDDSFAAVARAHAAGTAGLPVGVQLVGLPLREELVLRGMRELEKALRGEGEGCKAEEEGKEGKGWEGFAPEELVRKAVAESGGMRR
jgi:fatty acid amide hydrolase